MPELWLDLSNIPAEGQEYEIADAAIWESFFEEFSFAAEVTRPLTATIKVQIQGDGVLIDGRLTGAVALPCDRCLEPVGIDIDEAFTTYEEPATDDEEPEITLVREEEGRLELDAAGLLWQQFALALPVKILCDLGCKGLCPHCGQNLNEGECECGKDEGDPRLSVLRNLKIKD